MNAARTCWAGCLLGLLAAAGCDDSRPVIYDNPTPSVLYDTNYEQWLNSDKSSPLIEGAWREYVETLDEPVAIVNWQDGVSTWEVFFATNRGLAGGTSDASQQRFGNEYLAAPQFGVSQITLPRRHRGRDPQRAAEGSPQTAGPRETVYFEQVRSLPWEQAAAGLRQQIELSRQKDLLLFVHGFNVDFESALIRTAQMAFDMPFNGAVIAYSWPSQASVHSYRDDERFNLASVAPFAEFLQRLVADVPAGTRINIVTHSMGNRIVMQAIGQLPPPAAGKPLAHVALCAPDVGVDDFHEWAPGVLAQSERVTLYTSKGDAALVYSQGLHDVQRAGYASPPVIVPGIETIDCSAIDLDFLGHSYYGSNVDVLADLFAALKERRTAGERYYLTRRALPSGQHYWHYNAHAPRMLWTWNFGEGKVR